jgi:Family of unknown function (DUF5686)/CarboxypepD_reg-like domain
MQGFGFVGIILLLALGLRAQPADTVRHNDSAIGKPEVVAKDTAAIANIISVKAHSNRRDYYLTGKIIDANSSEGLPFATVIFPHSSIGTTTDIDGNFIINTQHLPHDTIQFGALGYKTYRKILQPDVHEYTLKIELERSSAIITEHVITAKGVDPALLLLRRIREHKPQNNPDRAKNYSYKAYNRLEADLERMNYQQFMKVPVLKSYGFIFNNLDTTTDSKPYLPLYLTESLSDYYNRRTPPKQREIIQGSMVKGFNNDDVVKYLGTLYQNVNVYANAIPVFDKKFISPISDEGPFFYRYAIKDTQKAYNHTIYLVQFQPKRPGENCFTGDFWVVDSIFAIQRISMDVPSEANLNWVDHVSLFQEFVPIDSFWFCNKDKFVANFSFYNSKKIPGFIGRKTTTYHDIKINHPETDSLLENPAWKDEIIKTDSVMHKSDDWWAQNRPDSLTKTEKGIHKMVDTINSMPITTTYKNFVTFLVSGVKDVGPIELGPYFYLYSSNPKEGDRVRLSVGTPRTLNDLHVTGYLAYGFKDEKFKYGIEGRYILDRNPWSYINASYSSDLSQGLDNFNHLQTDNILSTIIRKPGIEWKQVFEEKLRVEYLKQYYSSFSYTITLQNRSLLPFAPLPTYNIFHDEHGTPTEKVISTDVGLVLHYAHKEKYLFGKYKRRIFSSRYPSLDLGLTRGVKGPFQSAYEYSKANIIIKQNVNVPPFGNIVYNIFAGKIFGTLPYLLLEVHPGNEYLYYDKYAFEMMNNYEFISDRYVGFTFEHNLGGGLFNYIPLLKQLKFRQFWTAKGVVGSLDRENSRLNLNQGFPFRTLRGEPYLELGTGVSNIFQIFRIDFDWRVMPKPLAEESPTKYFGIFFSAIFDF